MPEAVKKNCAACAYSGMAPDDDFLVCAHPDAGEMGAYVREIHKGLPHCPDFAKFKQHPKRNPDGSLKGTR
jgi:hypothetical protein